MKKIFLLLMTLGVLTSVSAQKSTEISSAKVSFVFVDKDVDGSIGGFKTTAAITLEDITSSTFSGSVAVGTIKTGNFLRDWSLKGKYFDEDNYPKIKFSSTAVEQVGSRIKVTGELTIKGKTKTEVFEFTKNNKQLLGTCTLNVFDYGIKIKKKREDNTVTVKIDLQLK